MPKDEKSDSTVHAIVLGAEVVTIVVVLSGRKQDLGEVVIHLNSC